MDYTQSVNGLKWNLECLGWNIIHWLVCCFVALNNKFHWKLFYRQINVRTLCNAMLNVQCAMCEPMHKSVRFRTWCIGEKRKYKSHRMNGGMFSVAVAIFLIYYVFICMQYLYIGNIQHPTFMCMEYGKWKGCSIRIILFRVRDNILWHSLYETPNLEHTVDVCFLMLCLYLYSFQYSRKCFAISIEYIELKNWKIDWTLIKTERKKKKTITKNERQPILDRCNQKRTYKASEFI